jgi:hypothetical protein
MLSIRKIWLLFALLFIWQKNFAYKESGITMFVSDSAEKAHKKAANKIPNRMTLCSAILPGLGQALNKKYWKIPVIYAGLGTLGYFIYKSNADVAQCHKELVYRYSDNGIHINSYQNSRFKGYSAEDVNTLRLDAKRNLDFYIIGAGLVYLFNLIDANVDGHFRTFDMSDKLSLSINAQSYFCAKSPVGTGIGVSVALTFK